METVKVNNNLKTFLLRYIFTIVLCYLTIFVTGRIADMDFLIGYLQYNAGGTSTTIARNIYGNFGFLGNIYLIVIAIASICSTFLYLILNNFIDKHNVKLWTFFLFTPGLLIYSNSATKETLFLYPAIIYIILEVFFLLGKRPYTNIIAFFAKTGLLFLMFIIRGDLVFPYIGLFFLSIIFKTFYFGAMSKKVDLKVSIIQSLFISILLVCLISILFPDYVQNKINYLGSSFENYKNTLRPVININFFQNPVKGFQIQYLSLFPTPIELFVKPYRILIIIDSFLITYVFYNSWRKLFKLINSYRVFKKITLTIFSYITIVYFSVYGYIGSFNLGSSQRLRINFFPIGIIFPLILEKEIRDKQRKKFFTHKKIY